jgi:hypothetical protein
MASRRLAGILTLRENGIAHSAKGEFSYNLGVPKRTSIVGMDTVHGFKEEPQVGFVEGEITDHVGVDLKKLCAGEGLTITLELANGKVIVLTEAWYAGEGTVSTGEANIAVRYECPGENAQEF